MALNQIMHGLFLKGFVIETAMFLFHLPVEGHLLCFSFFLSGQFILGV